MKRYSKSAVRKDYFGIVTIKGKKMNSFTNMVGRTFTEINGGTVGDDYMQFIAEDGSRFNFCHHQDCCETVSIEDVTGDISDLIGQPMLLAEEVDNEPNFTGDSGNYESCTWTFYKFATSNGYVTVRWLGTSNGYYSERVSFDEVIAK